MNSNTKKPTTAPPVYRPQPVPRVLQTKLAPVKTSPVFRPQPKPIATPAHVPLHAANIRTQVKSLALQNIGAPIAHTASCTVQLKKDDAKKFAEANGLGITVSYATVMKYVNNPTNDHSLRRGLLDAWNKNSTGMWTIPNPIDFVTNTTKFKHPNRKTYLGWTKKSQKISLTTSFGTGIVSAFHNRGAPKIGSTKTDWGNTTMGDKYTDYIKALRSGGLSDSQIAKALLKQNGSKFSTDLERRGGAMMDTTVYLAEEWRKQGAGKLYRGMLRSIKKGDTDFDDFQKDFKFIKSAQEGRKQIGRFYDVYNEDSEKKDLPKNERRYYDDISSGEEDDWSSDDEMRTEEKKNLKGKRLFAKKHTQ